MYTSFFILVEDCEGPMGHPTYLGYGQPDSESGHKKWGQLSQKKKSYIFFLKHSQKKTTFQKKRKWLITQQA